MKYFKFLSYRKQKSRGFSCLTVSFFLSAIFVLLAGAKAWSVASINEIRHEIWNGNITKAKQMAQEVLKKNPQNIEALKLSAVISKTLGKNNEAIAALNQALLLEPENAEILSELGWTNLSARENLAAQENFTKALKFNSNSIYDLLGLGISQLYKGNLKEAQEALESCEKLAPQFAAAKYFLSITHEKGNSLEKANDYAVQTLKKDWAFAEARVWLANLYAKRNLYARAYSQAQSVLSLDPRNSIINKFARKLAPHLPDISESAERLISKKNEWPEIKTVESLSATELRVGIWASPQGRPPLLKKIYFQTDQPFEIVGIKSGKSYGSGNPRETWAVRMVHSQYELVSSGGEVFGPFAGAIALRYKQLPGNFLIQQAQYRSGNWKQSYRNFAFRGGIEFHRLGGRGFYLVNVVGVEEYLLGVVPSEMPASWPKEALKAQAVIARNQAFVRKRWMRPHRRWGYDVCDNDHCQVYRAIQGEAESIYDVIHETKGELLFYKNGLAQTFFHSTCGGTTQSSREIWRMGSVPYLAGHPDTEPEHRDAFQLHQDPWKLERLLKSFPAAYCNNSSVAPNSEFRWLRIIPYDMLTRKLRRFGIGQLQAIIPIERSSGGYVTKVLIRGTRRSVTISQEYRIRHYLGLESLRSTFWTADFHLDEEGNPELWIWGGGWGHGVGLCQTGAASQAESKKKYEQILQFYYPETSLRTANQPTDY